MQARVAEAPLVSAITQILLEEHAQIYTHEHLTNRTLRRRNEQAHLEAKPAVKATRAQPAPEQKEPEGQTEKSSTPTQTPTSPSQRSRLPPGAVSVLGGVNPT